MEEFDITGQVEQFHCDGFLVLPGILPPGEVASLRDALEAAFSQPLETKEARLRGELVARIWRPRMFERGPQFENLIDRSPIVDLMEAILGNDCHMISMNALKTGPGDGISSWHADETVRFPRPAGVPLDPRIPVPCFIVNMNYYLCDVDEDLGPTQLVPGSHRSGRLPGLGDMASEDSPVYEGRGVFSATGPAGTAVLWHDQVWHRGAVNRSDRIRWVQQTAYGQRYMAQRFFPYVNYHMPEEILERADDRRKRLLGLHYPDNY